MQGFPESVRDKLAVFFFKTAVPYDCEADKRCRQAEQDDVQVGKHKWRQLCRCLDQLHDPWEQEKACDAKSSLLAGFVEQSADRS